MIRYGKRKKVGVWLWTVAATLFQHPHCYLDSISKWGAVRVKIDFFDRDDAQIIPQYEKIWQRLVLSGILWWIFMDAASLPDFIGHILISFLMKPYDVRNVLSGIPLLIRIISFNVSLPVCWEVELIILRVRCVTAHWKNLSRSIRGCLVHWGLVHMNWPLFVVLSAPFASLCDSPDEYRKYPDILKYLAEVPISWDQTIPFSCLCGRICCVG